MPGLISKVTRFASSPKGRRMTDKAKRFANDPKNRQKIDGYRRRFGGRSR